MNPYLEQRSIWPDFHGAFLYQLREAIAKRVAEKYFVQVGTRMVLRDETDQEEMRFLEIRESRNRRLVTVIELLSPSNKLPGQDREAYLTKRREILLSETHLVEIDLRRRKPSPPKLPESHYFLYVKKSEDWPRVTALWPFTLREPIPDVPIPLSSPDVPVVISMKDILDRAYDSGAFEHYLYDTLPEPPLTPEDEAWASGFIPAGRGPNAGR